MSTNCVEGKTFAYYGYKGACFSDKTDKFTPKLGYLPGPMPWYVASSLTGLGMSITEGETGKVVVHQELIMGDSPPASQVLGVTAVPIVTAYAKAKNL
jgi:molecular chaperone Hsp31 and glyoxalase 3